MRRWTIYKDEKGKYIKNIGVKIRFDDIEIRNGIKYLLLNKKVIATLDKSEYIYENIEEE